jgi:DNA polymerase-3 subunit delta
MTRIPSCLLVQGPDTYQLRRIEEDLVTSLVDPGFRDFNATFLEGLTALPSAAIAAARTPAFGPGARVVIVRDCPWFTAGGLSDDLEQDALSELVNHPLPPGGHLILVTASSIDRRLNLVTALLGTPDQWGQDPTFARPSTAPIAVLTFEHAEGGNETHAWLMAEARRKGTRLGDEEADWLIQRLGTDRWQLSQTLEKLDLYASGQPITEALIDELCPPGEVNVFELLDALAAGRVPVAIAVLRRLLVTQHALQVLAAITTVVRRWLIVRLGTEARTPDAELARHVGGKPFMVAKYRDKCRAWPTDRLELALHVLARTDRDLKSSGGGKAGEEGLLLQMLAQMAPPSRPAARPANRPR